MPTRQRISGAVAIVVLGGLAMVFVSPQVTRCLGGFDRTFVEAVRDGCLSPSVGPAWGIGAVTLVAAVLQLLPQPGVRLGRSAVGAVTGALIAVALYWLVRPIALTGRTSSGELIAVQLPIDWWALLAGATVGAGAGWVAGLWLSGRTQSRLGLSPGA
jgi:hypothetical protein